MAKNNTWDVAKTRMSAAVEGLHRKDEATREVKDRSREAADVAMIPLDDIRPRPHGDSRPLDDEHVLSLVESCGLLGLLQPLAVDRRYRLVCGGHRLAALTRLRTEAPQIFGRHFPDGTVPVRILVFDAESEPAAARGAELEENERRKAYTRDQVIAFATKLREDGYRFTVGRPKAGELALAPTLSQATGVSLRTVRRYLADEHVERVQAQPVVLSRDAVYGKACKSLRRAIRRFRLEADMSCSESIRQVLIQCSAVELALDALSVKMA